MSEREGAMEIALELLREENAKLQAELQETKEGLEWWRLCYCELGAKWSKAVAEVEEMKRIFK